MTKRITIRHLAAAAEQAQQRLAVAKRPARLRVSETPLDRDKPGDWTALAILALTGLAPDRRPLCDGKRQDMNAWGWQGCWERREALVRYLFEQLAHSPDRPRLAPVGLLRPLLAEGLRRAKQAGVRITFTQKLAVTGQIIRLYRHHLKKG